jgi:hypothetical protein
MAARRDPWSTASVLSTRAPIDETVRRAIEMIDRQS